MRQTWVVLQIQVLQIRICNTKYVLRIEYLILFWEVFCICIAIQFSTMYFVLPDLSCNTKKLFLQ